jgi:transposase
MTKTQVEVTPSLRPRRRWSKAEKERIVAAAMEPGAVVSAVAREAGIQASQLFRWRQRLHGSPRPASLALEVTTDAAALEVTTDAASIAALSSPLPPGVIEIEFATGVRLRICGPVATPIVSAVVQALANCRRR